MYTDQILIDVPTIGYLYLSGFSYFISSYNYRDPEFPVANPVEGAKALLGLVEDQISGKVNSILSAEELQYYKKELVIYLKSNGESNLTTIK